MTGACFSQAISRAVISSGGGYVSSASGRLYSNTGECLSNGLAAGSILTQGFLQPPNATVTAIESNELPGFFSAYPNPTHGVARISVCETCKLTSLEIYDYLGKKIDQSVGLQKLSDTEYQLDLSSLNSGIYFVRIPGSSANTETRIIRLIKL
jgi:hypothetical protein